MIARVMPARVVCRVGACAMLAALLVGCRATNPGAAPTAKDLVGPWLVVSAKLEKDGTATDYYGPDPKGALIFEPGGYYSLIVMRSDLPKFASDNREAGTPEENRAVVHGSVANYGRYEVADGNLVLHVESATFPNWNGGTQRRPLTLAGDELTYVVPAASSGGTATFVWRRTK